MEKQTTKIQINSLEALERLLGGDTVFEMEVRHSIAAAFAHRIKPAIAERVFKTVSSEIESLFIEKKIEKVGWDKKETVKLTAKAKELLTQETESIFNSSVKSLVDARINEIVKSSGIEAKILQAVQNIEREITDTVLTDKINKLVDKKIKERLNLQ